MTMLTATSLQKHVLCIPFRHSHAWQNFCWQVSLYVFCFPCRKRFTTDYSNAGLVHTTFCWVCSFLQMGPLREDHYFARGGLPLFFLLLCQWAGENIS
jgi:hypothetical protein